MDSVNYVDLTETTVLATINYVYVAYTLFLWERLILELRSTFYFFRDLILKTFLRRQPTPSKFSSTKRIEHSASQRDIKLSNFATKTQKMVSDSQAGYVPAKHVLKIWVNLSLNVLINKVFYKKRNVYHSTLLAE